MRRPLPITVVFLACIALTQAGKPPDDPVTTGPKNGALVIMGGGGRLELVFRRFVALAGGPEAKIVVVPTALSSSGDYDYENQKHLAALRKAIGLKPFKVVHTHDRAKADSEDFARPIREADGVWFTGGRQWRLADAYGGTLTETEFHEVLDRGGVIGGSSAGATIQGSFLIRGDTRGNQILIGDHQHGFGFLRNSAIDQHLVARGRVPDLIRTLTDPEKKMDPRIDRSALLGIGIDEDTAIIVRKNRLEVIGKPGGAVMIYDPRTWEADTPESEKYVTLKPGQRYDLRKRKIIVKAAAAPASR